MYYPLFSDLLMAHLRQADRSQAWLAQRLGVSYSTVTRWLNEQTRPKSPETIIRIADLLHVYNQHEREKLLSASGYAYVDNEKPIATEEIHGAIADNKTHITKDTTLDDIKQELTPLTKSFGKELFTILDSRGMSQRKFSSLVGFSTAAISQWRTGTRIPNATTLKKIGKVLNLKKLEQSTLLHSWLTTNYANNLSSVLITMEDNTHADDLKNIIDALKRQKTQLLD